MSRNMWILAALLATLVLASMWRASSGAPAPQWELCKESLVTQLFTGECTLRFKGERQPS